jgi:hypothetical protein
MVTKKKEQTPEQRAEKPVIVNRTRSGGKKKVDLFANIRNLPHPVEELLTPSSKLLSGFPDSESPGTQVRTSEHSADGVQDAQDVKAGHPAGADLSAFAPRMKNEAPRTPLIPDTQTPKVGETGHSKNSNWREYERKRSTVRVNLHIHKEVDKKVRQYCVSAEPRLELKDFYEKAALTLLDILGTQTENSLGANAPYDDRGLKMLWKSKPALINLYLQYNPKNKWKLKDDEAAARFNEVDERIIELGILQTLGNRGFTGRINSFSYFVPEIETWIETNLPEESLESVLKVLRSKWLSQSSREGK